MVFMCRFCKPECSAAFLSQKLAPRWRDSYYIIVSTSGFDVLIECTDFMHVPKHSPKMKNIIIFWPLGALGRFLQLARSCHRITLIEPYPLSSTSHYYLPEVAHFNDLLRQQSENVFWTSKNRHFLQFCAVFLDFLIFSILNDFKVFGVSILAPWLDFLPGAAPESIWAVILIVFRFFCSYGVHVPILQARMLGRVPFPEART